MEHPEVDRLWQESWNPRLRTVPAGDDSESETDDEDTQPLYALKGYQRRAISFLHKCKAEFGMALIGDEMGVGKVHRP
jgi:hypothetical protein